MSIDIFKLGYPAPSQAIINGVDTNIYSSAYENTKVYVSNYVVYDIGTHAVTISN